MGLKLFSFRGGIHPPSNKYFTENKPIERAKVPPMVYIPLQQHIGAPCEALVKPKDEVKMGQIIGEQRGFVSAPVHSSVSGRVKSIELFPSPTGDKVMTAIIENDGLDTIDESILGADVDTLSAQELKNIILSAGIVGMGGGTFPTHVKLSPPAEKDIDVIILNGAECEPYLTADHRLMVEEPEKIIEGLRLIMKVLDVKKGFIGIEDNKPDAIRSMEDALIGDPDIRVKPLKTKYPQGAEKQLIEVITGRQVPSGGLPMDVGVVVNNVATAYQVYEAAKTGMPLIERVVTVSGKGIVEPKNLIVRIGTLFKDVIEECGGFKGEPGKVIAGGPMMGIAQYTTEVPVAKGTSGILVLTPEESEAGPVGPCIRCGKCMKVCPIRLMPLNISAYSLKGDYETCESFHPLDCIECGSCSFICPANRPLLPSIRVAKREIIAKKNKGPSTGN